MQQLFAPEFRTAYYRTTGKQSPNRQIEAEGGPYKRPSAGGGAAADTSTTVGTDDPSIAKAKAAKVDTSIVGLPFGEPLQLPQCAPLNFGAVYDAAAGRSTVPVTCIYKSLFGGSGGGLGSLFPVDNSGVPDITAISLSKEYCPAWVPDCAAYATLDNGRLAGIVLLTKSRGHEKAVTNDLRAKYGPPTRVRTATVTPDVGSAFKANHPEWTLPGLYVEYEVVLSEGDSERVKLC